ncbi:MAG: DEAD/DEAH box helicase [Synergistaceae bacterium]|nr:DEAD/DEAH box helicase [Synergistaceae bacterium]
MEISPLTFFNEEKREKLMEIYYSLAAFERKAYRALSVVYAPISARLLAVILNDVSRGKSAVNIKWNARGNLCALLEKCEKLGLARRLYASSNSQWICNRLTSEPVLLEALALGEFGRFLAAIDKQSELSGTRRSWNNLLFDSQAYFTRELRRAVYLADEKRFLNLIQEGSYLMSHELESAVQKDIPSCPILIQVFFNPVDVKMIEALPRLIFTTAVMAGEQFLSEYPHIRKSLKKLIEKGIKLYGDDPGLIKCGASRLLAEGCHDDAEKLILGTNVGLNGEREAMLAVIALMKGDWSGAYATYEAGIKQKRSENRRRKVCFSGWYGAFYPILMAKSGVPSKKILDYSDFSAEANIPLGFTYSLIKFFMADGADRERIFSDDIISNIENPDSATDVLFFALLANWINQEKSRGFLRIFRETCLTMIDLEMKFPASEMASLIRELSGDAHEFPSLAEPRYPLKDLIRHKSYWEHSLDSLLDIASSATPKNTNGSASKRLIWQMDWRSGEDKKAREFSIAPLEQVSNRRGWSAGKEVSLKRLKKNPETLTSLSEQDRSVLSAIRSERSYYSEYFYIDSIKMLKNLAGHPLVFRGKTPDRVELTKDEPRLLALSTGDKYILRVDPYPDGNELENRLVVLEESHNCLRLVQFEEKHVRMACILGLSGLAVPETAKDIVLKTLGGLASVMTVHSDIAGVESGAESVAPDGRIYVQLQPKGDGLDVEAVARPLGPGSAPCVPGLGGPNIFGLRNASRVQTRRDMDREAGALRFFAGACVALASAEQTSENRWSFAGADLSLEFLLQLQDIGDAIVAEWPKGGARSVRRLAKSDINMSVRASRDWFSVSGEIKVDEELVLGMKEVVRLAGESNCRFIPIGKDRFLAITEEFRRRLEDLSAVGDIRGDEIKISPLSIALFTDIYGEVGDFDCGLDWKARLARIDEAAVMNPEIPSTFQGELRGYQIDGFMWLMRLAHWGAGACLADDMGLGKTIQALAVLLARGPDGPALVVAPTSVCQNWIEEASRFAPTLRVCELRNSDRKSLVNSLGAMDVLVATYGLFQSEQEILCGIQWHTIVLDEAQAIKNTGTKRSAAAMKLNGDFRIITTGTPIENNLAELWNLFRFINPHYLGSMDSFNRKFSIPIERDGDKSVRRRLKRIISPFILRRAKSQVLTELPPKTEITIRVDLKDEERAIYEAVRRNALDELSSISEGDRRFMIFAQLVKMRRACCNSALVLRDADFPRPSAKLEAFSDVMEELKAGGHKALVFSQFVDHLAILRARMDEMGVTYQYLDGSTPPADRVRSVKAFQSGDGECFLISLKAGGTGLNLTAADYVVHMDPWWNPAVEEQASDRTHRIGQSRPVTIYRIVAKDTVEEKIVNLHAWKRDLAESLLDESGVPARLSAEEMMKLIRD